MSKGKLGRVLCFCFCERRGGGGDGSGAMWESETMLLLFLGLSACFGWVGFCLSLSLFRHFGGFVALV